MTERPLTYLPRCIALLVTLLIRVIPSCLVLRAYHFHSTYAFLPSWVWVVVIPSIRHLDGLVGMGHDAKNVLVKGEKKSGDRCSLKGPCSIHPDACSRHRGGVKTVEWTLPTLGVSLLPGDLQNKGSFEDLLENRGVDCLSVICHPTYSS